MRKTKSLRSMVFGDAQIRGGGSKSRDDSVYHYGYHNLFDVRSDYYSHPSTFALGKHA